VSLVRLNPLSKNLFLGANGNRCHKQPGARDLRHGVTGVTVAPLADAGIEGGLTGPGSDGI